MIDLIGAGVTILGWEAAKYLIKMWDLRKDMPAAWRCPLCKEGASFSVRTNSQEVLEEIIETHNNTFHMNGQTKP